MKKFVILITLCLILIVTGCGSASKKEAGRKEKQKIEMEKAEIKEDVITPLESAMKTKQASKIIEIVSEQSDYYEPLNQIVHNVDPAMTSEMYRAYLQTRINDQYEIKEANGEYYLSFTGEVIDLLSLTSSGLYTDFNSFQVALSQQLKNNVEISVRLIKEDGNWKVDPSDINFGIVLFGGTVVQ